MASKCHSQCHSQQTNQARPAMLYLSIRSLTFTTAPPSPNIPAITPAMLQMAGNTRLCTAQHSTATEHRTAHSRRLAFCKNVWRALTRPNASLHKNCSHCRYVPNCCARSHHCTASIMPSCVSTLRSVQHIASRTSTSTLGCMAGNLVNAAAATWCWLHVNIRY
jgi:hypothetical protein